MKFIGHAYRFATDAVNAVIHRGEPEVLIDTGSPHPRMQDGYAVAQIRDASIPGGTAVAQVADAPKSNSNRSSNARF